MADDKPLSIFQKRWRKFQTLRRGWYSFVLLVGALLLSFLNPLFINNRALMVSYQDDVRFPVFEGHIEYDELGQKGTIGEAKYRALRRQYAEEGNGDWVLMPPYPYHPNESLLRDRHELVDAFDRPSAAHWMGLDDRGRDVFARLVYGFRVSMLFGLGVLAGAYAFGTLVGAILGFFGGRIDILGQRLVEIWSGMPFLYTVIIISSILQPSVVVLALLLVIFRWMRISYYVRGEFYREKSKDYVAAAVGQGESSPSIMVRHLLPNSLTPIISFAPFGLVGYITSLVALDFLGFGVPAPTPSWGELVGQGLNNVAGGAWHLVLFPLGALFVTLLMVVFIGEAVREAFDPKIYSRLR